MDWITDKIAIGNHQEALDTQLLHQERISSVLGLTMALDGKDPKEMGLARIRIIPLRDGSGNDLGVFRMAVSALSILASQVPPVLVHCRAGLNRSPVVVAGYLMKSRQITADEALGIVASRRQIFVTQVLKELLTTLG